MQSEHPLKKLVNDQSVKDDDFRQMVKQYLESLEKNEKESDNQMMYKMEPFDNSMEELEMWPSLDKLFLSDIKNTLSKFNTLFNDKQFNFSNFPNKTYSRYENKYETISSNGNRVSKRVLGIDRLKDGKNEHFEKREIENPSEKIVEILMPNKERRVYKYDKTQPQLENSGTNTSHKRHRHSHRYSHNHGTNDKQTYSLKK